MPRSTKRSAFRISLDEQPEIRWREVLSTFKPQIVALLKSSEDLKAFDALGPSARFACRKLLLTLPAEQQREVRSAAEELGIDLHVAAASQILYEAAVFGENLEALAGNAEAEGSGSPRARIGCTAVAVDCIDVPVHARTLDWMMPGVDPRKFAALLVDLTFTCGGRELYSCTSIAGYLGVLTGVRAGAFSLSINFRKPLCGTWTDLPTDAPSNTAEGTSALELPSSRLRSLAQLGGVATTALLGGWPIVFLARHLLETCSTYDAALQALAGVAPSTPTGWTLGGARLLAPCYVMLVGASAGEGSLLTCDRGLRKYVQQLGDDGVLAVANCDVHAGCEELPAAAELRASFTPCTAKDEQQGESLLRRDLALRALSALRALTPHSTSSVPARAPLPARASRSLLSVEARASLIELLRACPIGNEDTVHESILCAGRAPALTSSLSPWPARFRRAHDLFDECCAEGCDEPTWYLNEMRRANSTPARGGQRKRKIDDDCDGVLVVVPPSCYNGSLPKRRGSMYYCEAHALLESECSVLGE